MAEPLISVVVPVYKVEQYLDRCVQSVCAQTYRNLEIILVDDGSPDNCGEMCEAWRAKDERVRVLHKANGGLSDARNRGAALARGEYISFLDSDDYLAPDALEYLLGLLRQHDADIAIGALRAVPGGEERFERQPEEQLTVMDAEACCRALLAFQFDEQLIVACAKLCAAPLVQQNPFPLGRLHEDEATTYKYYDQCRRVVLSNRAVYAYFQNPGSITHNETARNREQKLLAFEEQLQYFAGRGEEGLADAAADRLVNYTVDFAARGDRVCADYFRAGMLRPLLCRALRRKTRIRYWGYALLRLDLNKLYHKILGR